MSTVSKTYYFSIHGSCDDKVAMIVYIVDNYGYNVEYNINN